MANKKPDVTVITPVGPGHGEIAQAALQSVMRAADEQDVFARVFHVLGDDTQGVVGRSRARNRMVKGGMSPAGVPCAEPWMMVFGTTDVEAAAFESEWLFFLDADDLMCGSWTYGPNPFEVVGPYLADWDAVWGSIHELHPNGKIFKRNQVDAIPDYRTYVNAPAALTCQMGHFIRRDKFEGFDESVDIAEDVRHYLYCWQHLRCIKVPEPLFLNRRGAHTWMRPGADGKLRNTGADWSAEVEGLLKEARAKLKAEGRVPGTDGPKDESGQPGRDVTE